MIELCVIYTVIIFLVFFFLKYIHFHHKMLEKINEVKLFKKDLDLKFSERFSDFEKLLNDVKGVIEYEHTILASIAALRSQAQAAKIKGCYDMQMSLEDRVSFLLSGLSKTLAGYDVLSDDNLRLLKRLSDKEKEFLVSKQNYNILLANLSDMKRNAFFKVFIKVSNEKTTFNSWV